MSSDTIPVNHALMSLVQFAEDVIEWLDKYPDIKEQFYDYSVKEANSPETMETASQEKIDEAKWRADEAIQTTKRTTDAIKVLFWDDYVQHAASRAVQQYARALPFNPLGIHEPHAEVEISLVKSDELTPACLNGDHFMNCKELTGIDCKCPCHTIPGVTFPKEEGR